MTEIRFLNRQTRRSKPRETDPAQTVEVVPGRPYRNSRPHYGRNQKVRMPDGSVGKFKRAVVETADGHEFAVRLPR